MSCVVRGCRSHSGIRENLNAKISFHKFPKTENIRRVWFTATGRSEKQHKHHWRVCSRHFKPECFEDANILRARLKEDAVPTLNLSNKTEVALGLANLDRSSKQQRSTRESATCDKTCPGINVSQQESSTSVSVLPMVQTTTSTTGLAETSTATLKAIYEGRIHKLQSRIRKLELIAKNRLLKLNAEKQRTRRLNKKNSSINQRLIELLEREKL